jgi:hypothetical protein
MSENILLVQRSLKSWGFLATDEGAQAKKKPDKRPIMPDRDALTPIVNAAEIAEFLCVAELRRTGFPASIIVTPYAR